MRVSHFSVAVLLLTASAALAAAPSLNITKGVGKDGRHFAITLTGKLNAKTLPPDEAMLRAKFDVAQYLRDACGANPDNVRCDVYAGFDSKLTLAPGYVMAATRNGAVYYTPEFMNRATPAPRFSCLPAGAKEPGGVSGKDVLEGVGPVLLLRDGAGLKLNYNKAYGCKVDIDDHFDLIGTIIYSK